MVRIWSEVSGSCERWLDTLATTTGDIFAMAAMGEELAQMERRREELKVCRSGQVFEMILGCFSLPREASQCSICVVKV